MGYILGIDQGGTKTAAAIMREDGTIVGTAVVKGAYYPKHGVSAALDRMEEFPDFKFTHSSIGYLEWLQINCPHIFERIRQREQEGRWEVAV